MNGQHIGKARKNRAHGAIAFRALSVNNVRLDCMKFFPRRTDATLVGRAHPTDFGNEQAVKPNIISQFPGRWHGLLGAGNHMDFNFRQRGESLQQRLRRCAEVRSGLPIITKSLPVVRCDNGGFHPDIFKDVGQNLKKNRSGRLFVSFPTYLLTF
jgi:hypothetical protein